MIAKDMIWNEMTQSNYTQRTPAMLPAYSSSSHKDGTQPVDARAEWNGTPFDGPAEYKALLVQQPHEFTRGFIEHLLSYALGRPLEIYDMPVVAKIEGAAKAEGWKLSRVIMEITQSYPFTHIRSTP